MPSSRRPRRLTFRCDEHKPKMQGELKIANERIQKDQVDMENAQALIKRHAETLGAQRSSFEKFEEAIAKLQTALKDSDFEIFGKDRRLTQLSSSIGNLETQVMMHEKERTPLSSEVDHWKEIASRPGGVSSLEVIASLEKIQKEHRDEVSSLRLELENHKNNHARGNA